MVSGFGAVDVRVLEVCDLDEAVLDGWGMLALDFCRGKQNERNINPLAKAFVWNYFMTQYDDHGHNSIRYILLESSKQEQKMSQKNTPGRTSK